MLELSKRIRDLRIHKNLDQTTLAKRLGCSKSIICCYEQGSRTPSISMLIKYAYEFNISVDYLLGIENRKAIYIDSLSIEQTIIIEETIKQFKILQEKNNKRL